MVDYQKDFTELCALLNANVVDYVIVLRNQKPR